MKYLDNSCFYINNFNLSYKNQSKNEIDLYHLPKEILLKIFEMVISTAESDFTNLSLAHKTIINLSLVCKKFKNLIAADCFWKSIAQKFSIEKTSGSWKESIIKKYKEGNKGRMLALIFINYLNDRD